MALININTYKKNKGLKAILKDINHLITVLEQLTKILQNYNHYIPIARILTTIRSELTILKSHKTNTEDVISGKKV